MKSGGASTGRRRGLLEEGKAGGCAGEWRCSTPHRKRQRLEASSMAVFALVVVGG
jgi:hypothetical protein